MVELPAEVEKALADMSDGEFAALTAKLRAPDTAEAFRSAAAQHISGDQLDAVCAVANVAGFVGPDGKVDEAKVANGVRALFGLPGEHRPPQWQQQGQYTPAPPMPGPGDRGRAAAAKRFGASPPGDSGSKRSGRAR